MAAQLPRPGVEVVQEFRSTSPTIVQPTLVPCNVAPFFEVIEVLSPDGTANADAKLASLYQQLGLTVSQTSFPSPRGNIDEVNVDEDSIRVFFLFGGALLELSRSSSFLKALDIATQPFVTGTLAGPFNLDGRKLIVAFDAHTAVANGAATPSDAHFPTSANVSITFDADGMTIDDVIEAVNAIIPGVASNDGTGKLRLTSTKFGAGASVIVRSNGSANSILGFSTTKHRVAAGRGFFALDDGDSDTTSPRIEEFLGTSERDHDAVNTPLGSLTSFVATTIKPGDTVVADGVNIGEVQVVQPNRLVMEVEQNIMSSSTRFAPRRFWVQANGLTFPAPAASTAASLTGSEQTAPASAAFIVAQAAGTFPIAAGETFDVDIIKAGVALSTQTVSSGAGWATLAAAVAGINGTSGIEFEAYFANVAGDEVPSALAQRIALRTKADNKGSGASITLASQTVGMTLGFSGLPVADVGENIRYLKGTYAKKTSTLWVGGTGAASGQTIIYSVEVLGSAPAGSPETITWSASHANTGPGLDAAVLDWNGQARFTEAYRSTSTGAADPAGTYLSFRTRGENFGSTAKVQVTGGTATPANFTTDGAFLTGVDTDLNGANFQWKLDFNPKVHDVTFVTTEDDGGVSLQAVINLINGQTPGVASESSDSPPKLVLTSGMVGEPSQVKIGGGTANGFTPGPVGGLGFVLDQEATGDGRPLPDLSIDILGNVIIQNQILRDGLTGAPFNPGFAQIYMSYKGLRLDVSPDADDPGLLTLNGVSEISDLVSPISTDNPGGLMCFLSSLNAPGTAIAAIGVPEVSADAPDGTPLGYAKCFQFLESEEVYAIATASQIGVVHQAGLTHVNFMSEPENKGERIYFFNPKIPTRALPTILGSGTDANSTATPGEITLDVNIAPALIENGIDPGGDINPTSGAIENEVYLNLGGDDLFYLVQKVTAGTTLALRKDFVAGDGNDDAFYATAFPGTVISDNWTVEIRGKKLLIPGSTQEDKNATAETIQKANQAYGFRRGFSVHPDKCGINVTGLEQIVEGYYATACIVGMVANLAPQQGFTNFPITGLTRVVGSNDKYTEKQLNIMAAGGTYILVQDAQGAPVVCRHQLSTDMSSIEVRELSITKVVDFTAKFMRTGLRNFIGRSNITQAFLDQLGTVVQGLGSFLVENGVLIGFDVNNLIQDADAPDTILIDVTLDVPFPCNYIRLTLVI
jgi:hypothetical protein